MDIHYQISVGTEYDHNNMKDEGTLKLSSGKPTREPRYEMAASRKAIRPRIAIRLAATELTTFTAAIAPFDAASITFRAGLYQDD